ncbi:hypothetical protein ACQEU3_13005 [Spirillospora sp. CA-253888]
MGGFGVAEFVIPLLVALVYAAPVAAVLLYLGRRARRRNDELARFRAAAEESALRQREMSAQIKELTTRVHAVEDLLRSVG